MPHLWHDEAPAAFFGKTLLQQGDIVGWDGRNLVGGTNGRTLNDELRDVLPPLMYVLNAAGFAVFGINIVVFGSLRKDYWERVKADYVVAAELDVYPYPTQRPELNMHAFTPLPQKRGVHILRRKE